MMEYRQIVRTANEYYVYAKDGMPGTIGTGVYYFNTENAVEGYSKWGMILQKVKIQITQDII